MRPRYYLWVIVLGALGASAGGTSSALAQTPPAGAQAAPPTAGTTTAPNIADLYKEAVAAFKAGDFPKAYKGFLDVWALEKKPRTAGNLGRTELKLAKYCDAAEHLALFLRDQPGLSPDDRKEINGLLDEAKSKVATLRLEVDAEISVDGASVPPAPLARDLCVAPGKHKIEARHGVFKAAAEQEVAPGATATTKLDLTPPKPDVVGPVGRESGGADSKSTATRNVVLIGGIGLAVAGGVLMGVAVGQQGVAMKLVADQKKGPLCEKANSGTQDSPQIEGVDCNKVRTLATTADTLGGVGVGLLVTGGAVAAAAAVYWLWPSPPKAPGVTGSRVVPVIGPDGAGLLWQGSF